jgi:hypothetical protein
MPKRINENIPQVFDTLFKVLSNPKFLNKEGLGGNIPFFIHSFPVEKLNEVDVQINSLIKRLAVENINVLDVNLYRLCIDLLKEDNLLTQILDREEGLPKIRFSKVLNSSLNIDSKIVPEIRNRIDLAQPNIIFITGIAPVFPVIRSHTILNNLQSLVDSIPLVMFFPGTYNNQSLTLFNRLKDDNYYRAHNLNEYKI